MIAGCPVLVIRGRRHYLAGGGRFYRYGNCWVFTGITTTPVTVPATIAALELRDRQQVAA